MTALPQTMRALELTAHDGPQAVMLIEAPVPQPGPGEVLVRVTAAGVNFADTMQTRGTYPLAPKPPYIAGFEAVGEIVALGEGVNDRQLGDHVLGAGPGAFAEYTAWPSAALTPVPLGWSGPQTLGLLTNWSTAYAALRTVGRATVGETVLVHAAAGGVGQAAVVLASYFGAQVIATASTADKLARAKELGADHVLNYREADITEQVLALTNGKGAALVLDGVGGEVFRTSLKVAAPTTGRIVIFGIAAGEAAVTNRELLFDHPTQIIGLNLATIIQTRPELFGQIMSELSSLITEGVINPAEPTSFPLSEGPRVLADLEQRRTSGKLALVP